jgi:dTDP-glucose 4,6-dehydratase
VTTLLVTGGAGFIGASYVARRLATTADRVVVLDALTYAGNLESLAPVERHPGYRFVRGDVRDADVVDRVMREERPELVVHFAAESHVDRSILGPRVFTETNVLGTHVLLDAARAHGVRRFLQVSTDEVYGSLGAEGAFTETSPLAPSSPYSASKAAADLLCLSYHRTFGLDVVVTRCSNNYGPHQFPEKLIPLMIINALESKPLPVYGDGRQVRDWLHVHDHCAAIDRVLADGRAGEVYNVGGNNERFNLDVVHLVLDHLGAPRSLVRHVADRPGHDRRYAIDATKLESELGWRPSRTFPEALRETIDWYVANRTWWEHVRSGAYRDYYDAQYGARL